MDEEVPNAGSQSAGREGLNDDDNAAATPEVAAADEHALETVAQPTPEVKVQSSSRPTTSSSAATESAPEGKGANAPSQRSTSSKFANLRAAFEAKGASPNGSPDNAAKRRLTSSSELNISKSRERSQEHEAEIARLRDELEKERELRIAYEDKVTTLEEEMDETSRKLLAQADELTAALQKITALEQAQNGGPKNDVQEESDAEDEDGEDAETSAQNDGKEHTVALQRQLSDLKRSISRSMRPMGQLTDTTLRQEIGLLQHEIQNWVVNNFRKAKPEASAAEMCEKLHRIAEPEQVENLWPLYEDFDVGVKLAIYQATVAVYMMEIFADRFLFGLRGQHDWAKRTRQAAETLPAALDSVTFNRWRAVTFSALTQSAVLKEPVESAAGGMAEMICITLNAVAEMEESEARMNSLRTIVRRTISLAHQMRAQQSQYDFVLPSPNDTFEISAMDDIFDDGEIDDGRIVRCATFPSLFKIADDDGIVLEPKKTVFRAKVLCKEADDG